MNSLYIISEGPDGPVKIGVCVSIVRRLKGLQTGNPRPLRMAGAFVGVGSRERDIHAKLSHVRMMGEWFSLSEQAARQFIRDYFAREAMEVIEVKYDENNQGAWE